VSTWRWKPLIYVGLLAGALIILPGPTLILMLLLLAPYLVFVAGGPRLGATRMAISIALSAVVLGLALPGATPLSSTASPVPCLWRSIPSGPIHGLAPA
jgi:hypothetical protein